MSLALRTILAVSFVGGSAVLWGQEELVRSLKLKQVQGLLGAWDLQATIEEPRELAGLAFTGKVNVSWTLQKTALEFRAEGKSTHTNSKLEAMGVLAYDDAAVYAKRAYTAFFIQEGDGRMVSLRGNFRGSALTFSGQVVGDESLPLKVKLEGGSAKTIRVFGTSGGKEFALATFRLSRSSK